MIPWGTPSVTVAFLLHANGSAVQTHWAKWEERSSGSAALVTRAWRRLHARGLVPADSPPLNAWIHVADAGMSDLPLPLHPPGGLTVSTVTSERSATAALFPDYSYAGWRAIGFDAQAHSPGSFARSLVLSGLLPAREPLLPQAAFFGDRSLNPARRALVELAEEHPDTLWVRHVLATAEGGSAPPDGFVPFHELSRWSVLLDVPGGGWSGRLKFLPLLGRPLLVLDRRDWGWGDGVLRPFEHYRPVRVSQIDGTNAVDEAELLTQLRKQLKWVRTHPRGAAAMAERARRAALDAFDGVDEQAAQVLRLHAGQARSELGAEPQQRTRASHEWARTVEASLRPAG